MTAPETNEEVLARHEGNMRIVLNDAAAAGSVRPAIMLAAVASRTAILARMNGASPAQDVPAATIAAKIAEIRRQVQINVDISRRDHPEGPIVDGKRLPSVCHSQEILASHVLDRLNELATLLALPPAPEGEPS